jgi:lipid A 4'-phosphatase
MRRTLAAYAAALVLAAAVFLLFPGIDLWAAGLFYRPDAGFYLGNAWPVRAIYAGVPYLTDAAVAGVAALYLLSLRRGRPVAGVDGRVAAYLLLALALGPGLVVNTLLKDHWGRARPSQIEAFGGTRQFTPAPLPAVECARNCSFPAGHPAMGFYLVSFALLIRERRRRQAATGAAVAAGALIGLARMAQGGHFLSDVVFSGLIVTGVSLLLHGAIVANEPLARWTVRLRPPRRVALPALGLLVLLLLSIAFVDRPLARFFHESDPGFRDVFQFITQFGLAKGYLIITALLFVALRLAALGAERARAYALILLNARRALFLLLVLLSSGLIADIVKVIAGRARPKLLFADGVYGFTWGAAHADYWSFPSGHASNIVALAVALFLLWPRGAPLYAAAALLVAASRVIIGAHYLSDVLAGAVIGASVAWLVWRGFARRGIVLGTAAPQFLGASAGVQERYPLKPESQ